jgi:hypothetical protein
MTTWRTLIVVASAAAALAIGLGAQAGATSQADLRTFWQAGQAN